MTEHFSNIKDVLNSITLRNVNSTFGHIISDWDKIVGKKFAGKCSVLEFNTKSGEILLTLQTKSSAVSQELQFFKKNLIAKIKNIYNIEIADIIVKVSTSKNNAKNDCKANIVQEVYNARPSGAELDNITLDKAVIDKINASIEKQSTMSEEQKTRMADIIFKDLKTQEWMKQHGFPVCKVCGRVLTQKNFGEENICQFCKQRSDNNLD